MRSYSGKGILAFVPVTNSVQEVQAIVVFEWTRVDNVTTDEGKKMLFSGRVSGFGTRFLFRLETTWLATVPSTGELAPILYQ